MVPRLRRSNEKKREKEKVDRNSTSQYLKSITKRKVAIWATLTTGVT